MDYFSKKMHGIVKFNQKAKMQKLKKFQKKFFQAN